MPYDQRHNDAAKTGLVRHVDLKNSQNIFGTQHPLEQFRLDLFGFRVTE